MAEKQGSNLSVCAEPLTNLAMPMRELMRLPSDLLIVDQQEVRLRSDRKQGAQKIYSSWRGSDPRPQ